MAYVQLKKDEAFETMMKRFKKAVKKEGIMEELKKREYYMSPSLKAKEKSKAAQKRIKKFNK